MADQHPQPDILGVPLDRVEAVTLDGTHWLEVFGKIERNAPFGGPVLRFRIAQAPGGKKDRARFGIGQGDTIRVRENCIRGVKPKAEQKVYAFQAGAVEMAPKKNDRVWLPDGRGTVLGDPNSEGLLAVRVDPGLTHGSNVVIFHMSEVKVFTDEALRLEREQQRTPPDSIISQPCTFIVNSADLTKLLGAAIEHGICVGEAEAADPAEQVEKAVARFVAEPTWKEFLVARSFTAEEMEKATAGIEELVGAVFGQKKGR